MKEIWRDEIRPEQGPVKIVCGEHPQGPAAALQRVIEASWDPPAGHVMVSVQIERRPGDAGACYEVVFARKCDEAWT